MGQQREEDGVSESVIYCSLCKGEDLPHGTICPRAVESTERMSFVVDPESPLIKAAKEGPHHDWSEESLSPAEEGCVEIFTGPNAIENAKAAIDRGPPTIVEVPACLRCAGPLAGVLDGSLWCIICGQGHRRKVEVRPA